MLCGGEFLGHKASWLTLLPAGSLSVHCAYTQLGGITDEPYVLICFGVNWFDDWCLAAYVLDHVEAALVDWLPVEWGSILCHRQ